MKKIKLLTGLAGVVGLTACLVPVMTGCSCNKNGEEVEEYSVTMDVTGEAEVTFVEDRTNGLIVTFNVTETTKKVTQITAVTKGNATVDFSFDGDTQKLTITKDVIKANKGNVNIQLTVA